MEISLIAIALLALLLAGLCAMLVSHVSKARHEVRTASEECIAAQTKQEQHLQALADVRQENEALRAQKDAAIDAQRSAEKREALALQKLQDFEAQTQQMTQAAREAVVKAGSELSNKLLADHKREAEAARKETEERTQKVTDGLMEKFQSVTQSVNLLQEQSKTDRAKTDMLYRALSTPGGAGQHAEIGLENSLKSLGLEAGRDFVMQYHIAATDDSGRLRPDAVIFLPQGKVLVIDSKASKHLVDIAEHEGGGSEQAAFESLKRSMNTHLKALVSKDYKTAIEQAYRNAGRKDEVKSVISAMCLPNEAAVEKLLKADPEFKHKVQRENMLLISPVSLSALFTWASMEIGLERQAENQEKIIEQVRKLVDSVHAMLGHAEKISKGIKSAAEGLGAFGRSVNRMLLPRVSELSRMGVHASKNKALPKPLPVYEVRSNDDVLIDGEAEEAMILELPMNKAEG